MMKNNQENELKQNDNKISLFSEYKKNFKLKSPIIKLNKSKKSKTTFFTDKFKNYLKITNNYLNTSPINKNMTINNCINSNNNESTILATKNNTPKTCSNFFHKKKYNLTIRTDGLMNNKNNLINIINYSKLSSFFNDHINKNNNLRNYTGKPETKIKLSRKLNEFNSLEKYIYKAEKNIKEVKYEYKPNLNQFYMNEQLKSYINKSKTMIHAKNDLNSLYRDSHMLNSICDYVSNALFILKTKKRNYIRKANKELFQIRIDNLYQKMIALKTKKDQIPREKLFKNKTINNKDNIEINPRFKAQMIYKSSYPYNSIRTAFDRINNKNNLKLILKKKINIAI